MQGGGTGFINGIFGQSKTYRRGVSCQLLTSAKVRLVIEVDGSQPLDPHHVQKDLSRKNYLQSRGLLVLRFDNLQFPQKTNEMMEKIYEVVVTRLRCYEPSP